MRKRDAKDKEKRHRGNKDQISFDCRDLSVLGVGRN